LFGGTKPFYGCESAADFYFIYCLFIANFIYFIFLDLGYLLIMTRTRGRRPPEVFEGDLVT
jgi:hypothetical protein